MNKPDHKPQRCRKNIAVEAAQMKCPHPLSSWECGEYGHMCKECVAAAWAAWVKVRGPGWE